MWIHENKLNSIFIKLTCMSTSNSKKNQSSFFLWNLDDVFKICVLQKVFMKINIFVSYATQIK